ncbi:Sensor protein (fragment) [Bradyrhizobium sp. STM 3843]|uniref:sensor histidine kinase n=1 Tax=Bradyrhizobium sp. STM 3843 TaxID=551947 RepID=UPI0002403D54
MVLRIGALTVWIALIVPADLLAMDTSARATSISDQCDLCPSYYQNLLSAPCEALDAEIVRGLFRVISWELAAEIAVVFADLVGPSDGSMQIVQWGVYAARISTDNTTSLGEGSRWDGYGWPSLLVAATIIVQAGLIWILILERRRRNFAEFESRRRLSQLAHVHRQAIAGQLSSAIAHEINQPLGSILTNAETAELILNSENPDLSEVKQILADIRHDDQRASQVILHMRSLLKRTPFELKRQDMNLIVHDAFELMKPQAAARNVALYFQAHSTPLWVEGDTIQLQQVIINLIANAMDAMADMPFGRAIIGRTEISEEDALVSVADFGPGIPKDRRAGIFEPFVSTKEQGMGIGLSIARTIVLSHKGRIWADNQEQGGAVFFLALPLTK